MLAYLGLTSIAGHAYLYWRVREWRRRRHRSIAAQKAAATRKQNARSKPAAPSPRAASPKPPRPKKRKPLEDKVVQAKSAWFETVERLLEDPEPDFNEIDPADPNWKRQVRRFDGGTIEYAQRDKSADNVMP